MIQAEGLVLPLDRTKPSPAQPFIRLDGTAYLTLINMTWLSECPSAGVIVTFSDWLR